ncbi:MAG: MmgE/PrpD family protein [Moorellales bacterium]
MIYGSRQGEAEKTMQDAPSVIELLVDNVLTVGFRDLDPGMVAWAKTRVADILGCVVAGAKAPGNAELVELVKGWGGKEEATVLVYGGRVPAANAALVNCVLARSLDFGPVHPVVEGRGIPGHISETTVPTALTLAEAVGADGKELLTALIVGEDLAARVLAAGNFDLDQGWDCIGTVNTLAVVAIAGRLLGLNREQLRNAFGIALNQLAGTIQNVWDASTTFKLLQGLAARAGIFSAELAKAGWSGPKDPLFGRYGYFDLYTSGGADPGVLTRELGKSFYTDSCIKPYPCCRGNHAAIDCALALVRKHGLRPEEIGAVTVLLPPRGLKSFVARPFRRSDFSQTDALFSLRYTVAAALHHGRLGPEHLTPTAITDPRVGDLAAAVELAPLGEERRASAGVRVRLKDGRQFEEFTNVARGDRFANPLTEAEIREKFRKNLALGGISPEKAEALWQNVQDLEHQSVGDVLSPVIPV